MIISILFWLTVWSICSDELQNCACFIYHVHSSLFICFWLQWLKNHCNLILVNSIKICKHSSFYESRVTTGWRTKCHSIDCACNTFLLLQKHLTSGTELILIGWKIVPNEEHVQCDRRFTPQLLAIEPLHSSQLFNTSLQKHEAQLHYVGPELLVPNEEHVQCDRCFTSQLLANEPLHLSQLFDTSLQKAHSTTSLCGLWAALHFLASKAQLRAHIVKLCRALSEDLCRKVVMNARVRLQEVVR